MENVTFEILLTAAGAGIAATIVTGVISLIKTAFSNTIIGTWDGMIMAFVLSAALYLLGAFAVGANSLDQGLNIFLSWLTCATAAVGVHKAVVKPLIERSGQ